jgi:hypothetical protein
MRPRLAPRQVLNSVLLYKLCSPVFTSTCVAKPDFCKMSRIICALPCWAWLLRSVFEPRLCVQRSVSAVMQLWVLCQRLVSQVSCHILPFRRSILLHVLSISIYFSVGAGQPLLLPHLSYHVVKISELWFSQVRLQYLNLPKDAYSICIEG